MVQCLLQTEKYSTYLLGHDKCQEEKVEGGCLGYGIEEASDMYC